MVLDIFLKNLKGSWSFCQQTVKSYTTGRIGTIYKQSVWQEATVTFSNYGPGVRHVSIQSTGEWVFISFIQSESVTVSNIVLNSPSVSA